MVRPFVTIAILIVLAGLVILTPPLLWPEETGAATFTRATVTPASRAPEIAQQAKKWLAARGFAIDLAPSIPTFGGLGATIYRMELEPGLDCTVIVSSSESSGAVAIIGSWTIKGFRLTQHTRRAQALAFEQEFRKFLDSARP